ncbi:MAG: transcriptional regulator [Arcobacter sp.]|nr:MAG: transcriptional regulator [Arcobacter sp.]
MASDYGNATKEEIEKFYKQISDNVKSYRLEKGFSQMELGLEIGIKSVAFFSNCESNRYRKHFNIEHLYKLAIALDKDVCEFLK